MQLFKHYSPIERQVKLVIAAEFCVQLVNATFLTMLPLYLDKLGYSNDRISGYTSFRYLGVFLLAIPLGAFLKGASVKPLFYASCLGVPAFALAILYFVEKNNEPMTYTMLLLWGASFTFIQIPILPFILRIASAQNQTPAIALSYSTWSFAGIISGIGIALLDYIDPSLFDERMVLMIFSLLGFGGVVLIGMAGITEEKPRHVEKRSFSLLQYDWGIIVKALIPTLIIAVGAGLTIPVISLFFKQVHHMDKGVFSFFSSIAALLVAWGALLVPAIKEKIGFKIAVPATQSLAIISLVALGTTEYFNHIAVAVVIAVVCYLLRQPLMNLAGPMTSEIVMNYVGEKNREMVSALTSAIWSGSWFISGLMSKTMFASGWQFVNIFLVTSLIYAVGVIWYVFLIKDYDKKRKA